MKLVVVEWMSPRGLLAALRNPHRRFTAVVIGEPHRAFYGNQFGLTLPLFTHYDVQLWVPEVGGPSTPTTRPTIWSCPFSAG